MVFLGVRSLVKRAPVIYVYNNMHAQQVCLKCGPRHFAIEMPTSNIKKKIFVFDFLGGFSKSWNFKNVLKAWNSTKKTGKFRENGMHKCTMSYKIITDILFFMKYLSHEMYLTEFV